MKHRLLAIAMTGALAAGAALAAETDDLATQARRMDSLATSQGNARVESRISSDFTDFAGSTANSGALVTGLRNGTQVTLTSTDAKGVVTETQFTPLTGKMGYGNVYTSLALAKYQLAQMGITHPTAAELQAALNGGTITLNGKDVPITGVLELRAQGMGWGQIAQQYGTKLGPVISGMKSANAQVGSHAAATGTGVTTAVGVGASGQSHGQGNAYGRGITTGAGGGAGPASSHGQGNAYGRGITTGAGAGSAMGSSGNAGGKGKGN
jgi:hypothetical protein